MVQYSTRNAALARTRPVWAVWDRDGKPLRPMNRNLVAYQAAKQSTSCCGRNLGKEEEVDVKNSS